MQMGAFLLLTVSDSKRFLETCILDLSSLGFLFGWAEEVCWYCREFKSVV